MSADEKLIKSKKREKEFGEVYTPEWLVEKMLDLLPDEEFRADSKRNDMVEETSEWVELTNVRWKELTNSVRKN